MFILLLFALWTAYQTQAHLTYPINYCNMAATCIHDNSMVCASSPDGCSRRSFLDQCDMYEYNCDYGTRFQETYRLLCSIPMNQNGLFPQVTTKLAATTASKTAPTTVPTTTNTKLSTTPITKTTFIKPSTETQFLKEILPSTLSTSTVPVDSTKMKEQVYSVCCHRPKTWETTTETEKTVIIFETSIDNENTIELDKRAENSLQEETIFSLTTPETTKQSTKKIEYTLLTESTSTTPKTTTKHTTTTTKVMTKVTPPQITSTKIVQPTKVSTKDTLPHTKVSETVTPTKIINSTKTFTESCQNKTTETSTVTSKCCERPETWETTTEKEVEYFTETLKKLESSTTTVTTTTSTTTVAPVLTKVIPSKLHIEITATDTTPTKASTTDAPTTEETTKKYDTIENDSSYLSDSNGEISNYIPDDVPIKSSTTTGRTFMSKTSETSTRPTKYVPSSIEIVSATFSTNKQIYTSRAVPTRHKERLIKLKTIKPHIPSPYSWWYPKPCKSKQCQRPVTWETTTKRHKKYYGHH